MPLYEYQCDRCGRFELIRQFKEAPLKVCPTCGQSVQKLPSAPAIQFKGTGWYVTDYARKGSKEAAKENSSDSSSKPSSKESSSDSGSKPNSSESSTKSDSSPKGDAASGPK